MESIEDAASTLADEWLTKMSAIPWSDHASSMQRRAPYPCGETTSINTKFGLMDVSDSYRWVEAEGGSIRLTIEVFAGSDNGILAERTAIITRPT